MGNYLFPLTLKGEQVDVSVCLRVFDDSRARDASRFQRDARAYAGGQDR